MADHEGGDGAGAGQSEERRSSNPDNSDRENVSPFQKLQDGHCLRFSIILDSLLIRDAR
jgi:hypothetical protein